MKRKDMTEYEFRTYIISELFAREIQFTIDDGSFRSETLDRILNSIDVSWDIDKYRNSVYKLTEKILKEEYDLNMEDLKSICSKNI
jgi:hypothetical protein